MKRVLIGILVSICLIASSSFAADPTIYKFGTNRVTLLWDQNTEPELAGYIVYWGLASRNYPNKTDVGNVTSYPVVLPGDGMYYFAATAKDKGGGESDYSNEMQVLVDMTAPIITELGFTRSSGSRLITITSFKATDINGVAGYLITETSTKPLESATGWSPTVPTSFTMSAANVSTLYGWTKDSQGNVSNPFRILIQISAPRNVRISVTATSGN